MTFTQKNNRLPNRFSKNVKEAKLSKKVYRAIIRYTNISKECERMSSEYKHYCKDLKYGEKVKKYQKIFSEWKTWVETNNRLPSEYSQDEEERKIFFNMQNMSKSILRIQKDEQLIDIIDEYKQIRKKYAELRKIEKAKQTFDEWKTWVEKNEKIPDRLSYNNFERKTACNMYACITFLHEIGQHDSDIISEYRSIFSKYKK